MFLKSKDIAKILNISPSTVSLAINNKSGVSADTRNKIFAVLEEYYASGKFAVREKEESDISGSIVLIVHKTQKHLFIPNTFFQRVIEGIQSVAMQNNYLLKVTYYNTGMNKDILLDSLYEDNVAGVIVYSTELPYKEMEMYRELKKPLVVLDGRYPFEDMDTVSITNRNSIENAIEYAYEMGHKKIGFLKSHIRIRNFEDRFLAFRNGLSAFGLKYNEKYVFTVHCTLKGAYSDFLKILERPIDELPTIFLAEVDYTVAGALRAIKKKGYSVPDDFSLIGFDDIEIMAELDPPLTTIRIMDYFGAIAISRLIDKIEKKDDRHLNIEVATELIKRNSVKRLG